MICSIFSVVSVAAIICFSMALLNVLIRRESAYLVEERIRVIVESSRGLMDPVLDRVQDCDSGPDSVAFATFAEYLNATWPGTQSSSTVQFTRSAYNTDPLWIDSSSFAGVVEDHGNPEIRFIRTAKRKSCFVRILVRIPLSKLIIGQLSSAAGLTVVDNRPVKLLPYRRRQSMLGEIEANFMLGSSRPIPVVVVARNWESGLPDSWVICQIQPSYSRTMEDLGRMGLRRASWVSPFLTLGSILVFAYVCGMYFSIRLGQRIVTTIDMLSHAADRIGMGDFSFRIPYTGKDQLGLLIASFNRMAGHLENLRDQEKQRDALERDIELAQEAQQYLYPRSVPEIPGMKVWGMSKPARIVSGDLYDFFPFGRGAVGLLCADVSGKGMSAALMMAHLQAVAHGRMLALDRSHPRLCPRDFAEALNRDLLGCFGDNQYATMFYGEYDSGTDLLRYVNAGHCRPIFISKNGKVTAISDGDLPIGLFRGTLYHEIQLAVPKGCAVVVYSDGFIDALNSKGEEFGEERLLNYCKSLPKGATAQQIGVLLSERIAEWSAGVDQVDDTTLLVLTAD
jgi:serine phosphatase RsbU (regulator of sigma subunit)